MTSVFCTVSTPSHLHQAIACLMSIREHHENARCVLLLVHGGTYSQKLPEGIACLRLEDCISAEVLKGMDERYTVPELCFAVKPFLIRALLVSEVEQVHYFDGDCLILDNTNPLHVELGNADLLLTPHSLTPIPDDGLSPRPLTILRAGAFNAGYIGVRNTHQGRGFLNWLCSMTLKYAKNEPKAGMCGDQKWLDLAPALFSGLAVCRHSGANMAYWNLHERTLDIDAQGQFRVNGQPLIFFHFSGYDPAQPLQISKYQNRSQLVEGSPLHRLMQLYGIRITINYGNFIDQSGLPRKPFRFFWQ